MGMFSPQKREHTSLLWARRWPRAMICGIDSHVCRVALLTEGGVTHWPSAPTSVVGLQRTCRVATRVRTRVDFVSKRMHPWDPPSTTGQQPRLPRNPPVTTQLSPHGIKHDVGCYCVKWHILLPIYCGSSA